jgi:hypothetical protein
MPLRRFGIPERRALNVLRLSIPAFAWAGVARRRFFFFVVLAGMLAGLYKVLCFNGLQTAFGLINRRFLTVPVHFCKPRKDLVAVESQQAASFEVRHALDNLNRMGSRLTLTRPPSAAPSPALRSVASSLVNPRRPHVQELRDLLDRENLRNRHRQKLRKIKRPHVAAKILEIDRY